MAARSNRKTRPTRCARKPISMERSIVTSCAARIAESLRFARERADELTVDQIVVLQRAARALEMSF